ncbi:MAG: DUF5058 family protein [Erysipelotrichales bacterium]|nr:DUF5058 family protein [Erysipelotrichales bacterium]
MNEYLSAVNSSTFYLIVAAVLTYVTVMCFVFLIKSYKAGLELGMDKEKLKKTITSSATFTLLPSISILLGVVALSGSLGVPLSWLRLSVIGSLQYELNVAEIAAQSAGLSGLRLEELNVEVFTTIALVMTIGILGGIFCCIFFLKGYSNKLQRAPKKEKSNEPSFGDYATIAMFVGLCAAFIGAYIGKAFPREGSDILPLFTAAVSGGVMLIFDYLVQKKNMKSLENFDLAASMLVGMAAVVILNMML